MKIWLRIMKHYTKNQTTMSRVTKKDIATQSSMTVQPATNYTIELQRYHSQVLGPSGLNYSAISKYNFVISYRCYFD